MLRNFFGGSEAANSMRGVTLRHSSGWGFVLKHLRGAEGLRVLDIGSTSSGNINFVTGLEHSIYMADLVTEAQKPEWTLPAEGDLPERLDVERFLDENFEFSGRMFDVVLLWDAADYLPEALLVAVVKRIHQVLNRGGLVLALFHTKKEDAAGGFNRYHLTESEELSLKRVGDFGIKQVFNNRQIENLFKDFGSYKFFLAKDNLREVVITR